jgi:hypothetical protein
MKRLEQFTQARAKIHPVQPEGSRFGQTSRAYGRRPDFQMPFGPAIALLLQMG